MLLRLKLKKHKIKEMGSASPVFLKSTVSTVMSTMGSNNSPGRDRVRILQAFRNEPASGTTGSGLQFCPRSVKALGLMEFTASQ
jgi:hypothetical protein